MLLRIGNLFLTLGQIISIHPGARLQRDPKRPLDDNLARYIPALRIATTAFDGSQGIIPVNRFYSFDTTSPEAKALRAWAENEPGLLRVGKRFFNPTYIVSIHPDSRLQRDPKRPLDEKLHRWIPTLRVTTTAFDGSQGLVPVNMFFDFDIDSPEERTLRAWATKNGYNVMATGSEPTKRRSRKKQEP